MGDRRFLRPYERVRQAADRAAVIAALSDEEVIAALAAATAEPVLANVLATEAMNRVARARAVVTHLPDGVLTLDREGRITSVNPAAERHLDWPEAELRGRLAQETLQATDSQGRSLGREDCLLRLVVETGRTIRSEGEPIQRKDGHVLRVSIAVAPILRGGEITGVVVTFQPRDVSPAPVTGTGLARA